jgi:hypothetical protein
VPRQLTIVIAVIPCGGLVAMTESVTIRMVCRVGAIDIPNVRSSHSVRTQRGGGAPIAVGLILAALLIGGCGGLAPTVALAAFGGIGSADDLSGPTALSRLALHDVVALARHLVAAMIMAAFRAQPLLRMLDDPGPWASRFVTVHCDMLVDLASGLRHGPGIVASAREAAPPRAIFGSTTAVTTILASPSKRARLEAEEPIRSSGLDWTILRPTMICGAPGGWTWPTTSPQSGSDTARWRGADRGGPCLGRHADSQPRSRDQSGHTVLGAKNGA